MKVKLFYDHGDFQIEAEADTQKADFCAKQISELVAAFEEFGPHPAKRTPPAPVDTNKKEVIQEWVRLNPGHAANHVADNCGVPRSMSKVRELVASGHLVAAESLYYSNDGIRRTMKAGLWVSKDAPTLLGDARALVDWYSKLPSAVMGSSTLLRESPLPIKRAQQALIFAIEEKAWLSQVEHTIEGKPPYMAVVVAPLV